MIVKTVDFPKDIWEIEAGFQGEKIILGYGLS